MPKTRLAGRRSPVFFRGVGARPSTPFGPQAPVLADAPRTYLHRSKGAHVGTLALALPKDTPAQSAGAGSGRCARTPAPTAGAGSAVQVSAVPVGVPVISPHPSG